MEKTEHKLAVVHLVWMPLGIEVFRGFVRSYREHPAGCDHDLVILFNGVRRQEETADWHLALRESGVQYESHYLESGMDIEAYYWIAAKLSHRYILFLNSYSCLLTAQWGRYFLDAVGDDSTGAVSATGSWESQYSAVFTRNRFGWNFGKGFGENFRKYKLFVKALVYWRYLFRPFPNPHLRTNAFAIRREVFLSIEKPAVFRKKFTAYLYESGRRGLSGELLRRGYELMVVDRVGKLYRKEDWEKAAVFWTGGQENLLISDNQTRSYDMAGPEDKKKFTYLAWGK